MVRWSCDASHSFIRSIDRSIDRSIGCPSCPDTIQQQLDSIPPYPDNADSDLFVSQAAVQPSDRARPAHRLGYYHSDIIRTKHRIAASLTEDEQLGEAPGEAQAGAAATAAASTTISSIERGRGIVILQQGPPSEAAAGGGQGGGAAAAPPPPQ